jgi:carbon monoxide dehydrogenase subunit G
VRIEQQLTVAAPAERVWAFLMDVPAMALCLPGVSQVEQVAPDRYTARVTQRVGPIAASFDCQIAVVSLDEAAYAATSRVTGRDGKIGAGVKAVMSMKLEPQGDSVLLTLVADVDVSGKIAQYGHGIIKQRAGAMLDDFGRCVNERCAGASGAEGTEVS